MRIPIELPEDQLRALDAWCADRGISRAEAVRRAVAGLLAEEGKSGAELDAAFGLWKDRGIDGFAEQERLRDEWDDRRRY